MHPAFQFEFWDLLGCRMTARCRFLAAVSEHFQCDAARLGRAGVAFALRLRSPVFLPLLIVAFSVLITFFLILVIIIFLILPIFILLLEFSIVLIVSFALLIFLFHAFTFTSVFFHFQAVSTSPPLFISPFSSIFQSI